MKESYVFADCIVDGTCHSLHIYVITSTDVAPEGIDGLRRLSMFQLKVFPTTRFMAMYVHIHMHRYTITA